MKRWMLLLVTVLALGGASRAGADPVANAALAELRVRGGVCADEIQGVTLATYLQPIVCAGVGTPGTVSDQHDPWLRVEVQTDAKHQADVREWKLTMIGPDGRVLLDRKPLATATTESPTRDCSGPECQRTAVRLKVPQWKSGKYVFRLLYAPDPEIVSELTITLR